MAILQDIFIPTSHACRLLGLEPRNTRTLHRLKIPHKRDFTSLLWSRNAIYEEIKRRRILSKAPPNMLTLSDIADHLARSVPYTHFLLKHHKIRPTYTLIWNGHSYRNTPIYHKKQLEHLLDTLSFKKSSFPPEGWLEIKDCSLYLSKTPETVRFLCRKHKIRIKKLRHSKYLYNEDDIIALRKHLRSKSRKLYDPPTET